MNNIYLALAAFLLSMNSFAQESAKGYVFIDANKNKLKDGREQGLQGVAVSNGTDVVLTDKNGRYKIPVQNDNTIFVIKPAGYAPALDANNNPLFYYHHKPQGSPLLEHQGIAPTGPLPALLNFPLYELPEKDTIKAVIFGDPQISHPEDIHYFDKGIVAELYNATQYTFGISLGDIVGNKLERIPEYKSVVQKIGIPWYNVLGNHDINFDVQQDAHSDDTFERLFGTPNFSYHYGNAHFMLLDDVLYPFPAGSQNYKAGLREDQWLFIRNNLKHVPKNKLLVMACHIPVKQFSDTDRRRLFQEFRDFEHVLILSAHTHTQQQHFYGKEDGWFGKRDIHEYTAGTTCGDWYSGKLDEQGVPEAMMRDGTPKGYALLNIFQNDYIIDYKVAGASPDHQIGLFVPKVIREGRGSYGMYANFYMGSKRDTLFYRVDAGQWLPMTYTRVPDPNYVTKYYSWDTSDTLLPGKRSFYRGENSDHLWYTRFSPDLKEGTHTVEVMVKDHYGRIMKSATSFRVQKSGREPLLR